jgi:hypothetical protein
LTAQDTEQAIPDLPKAYHKYTLGMDAAALVDTLKADTAEFMYQEPDITLSQKGKIYEGSNESVEVAGRDFVSKAVFQLYDGALSVITLTLNTTLIDYYSVYQTWVKKYGQPQSLSPREAVWQDAAVRISLERPLTLKYIDLKAAGAIAQAAKTRANAIVTMQQQFLNQF